MEFLFIDNVLRKEKDRIVATKKVLPEDEYLKDHFPAFPIMPGVLMLETMVQAASGLLNKGSDSFVLGQVKSVKYGAMVKPNDELIVDIQVKKRNEDGSVVLKGVGSVKRYDSSETLTAVSGRFTMRPAILH